MADPTQNSRNPADSGHLAGALKEVMGKALAGTDNWLPAIVVNYDRTENRATVKPLIKLLKTDGGLLDRAEIASVPVLMVGGGNAVLTFNIVQGDLGWISASDRDISLFMQSMEAEGPNTIRMHDFADSVFIPDQFKKWTLSAQDDLENAAVLQSLDGTQRIAISDQRVRITSDFQVVIDSPLTITDAMLVVGNIIVVGDIQATGEVKAKNGAAILSTHTHTQANDSGGNTEVDTGAPVPT